MTPLVGTLVGVPAVGVSPLDCAGPNACEIVGIYTSVFFLALTFWYDAMHDARRTAQERSGEREPGGRWWWFHR